MSVHDAHVTDDLVMLDESRGLHEALEASVPPVATSVDGRRFEYRARGRGGRVRLGVEMPVRAVPADNPLAR